MATKKNTVNKNYQDLVSNVYKALVQLDTAIVAAEEAEVELNIYFPSLKYGGEFNLGDGYDINVSGHMTFTAGEDD